MKYKGKSLEEVLEKAEKDLGVSRDEFSYSVKEKKIGIFRKEVEIDIELKKEISKGEIMDGKFIFHKGEGEVRIIPTKDVIVKVNGKVIEEKTNVSQNDVIEFEDFIEEPYKGFTINIDEGGMEATLKVTSTPKIIYNVQNHDASDTVVVKGSIKSKGELEPISLDEVKKELVNKGIKFGVNFKEINEALTLGEGVIARGKEIIDAIDDKIIYFFNTEGRRRPVEVNGKVDYYSIEEIESVGKDDVLAILEEGSNGQNGVDIFGKIMEAKAKRPVHLKSGQGALLTEDGKKIISLIDGKPSLNGDKVCVLPTFQINGDADIKIGNLEFDGDIIISGSVKEGMKINAGGSIQVMGSALEARLYSKGDINIRGNLIASTAKAGNLELNELKYFEKLDEIKVFLDELIEVFEEMIVMLPRKYNALSETVVLKKIIDSKYNKQKVKFKDLLEEYNRIKLSSDIRNIFDRFFELYDGIMNDKNVQIKSLKELSIDTRAFLDDYNVKETNADVYVNYSQNSKIYSSKDVYINGKGCYCTDISAEGKVVIEGYPGTFRSGLVYAKKGVYIKEVGSSAGIKNIIKTDRGGEIHVGTIYHNTLLVVDNFNYYVDEPIRNVKVYVKNLELVVEKLKF